MTRHLLTLSLLLATGCSTCGEKEEAAAPPSKPEPPVVIYAHKPDGGRGSKRIMDLSERPSPFEAGTPDPP